jgi:transcriptional regulator with XRE-family HTH domain
MKDPEFEITVIIRNNRLKARRKKLGFSQIVMAQAIGITTKHYAEYETLKRSPFDKNGWRKDAILICEFFETEPDELWPEIVHMVTKNTVTRTVSAAEMNLFTGQHSCSSMLPPTRSLASKELSEALDRTLKTLNSSEEKVIRKRFGIGEKEKKPIDIARELNLTRARIGQIEIEALKKLRHPSRANKIMRDHTI